MQNCTLKTGVGSLLITLFLNSGLTMASMPENLYNESLRIAEKKVLRQKMSRLQERVTSTSLLNEQFGRTYQVGDQWDVAVWQIDRAMMRMTGDTSHLQDSVTQLGVFRYEVAGQKPGSIQLKVTPRVADGFSVIDPQVEFILLELNDQFRETKREYHFKNRSVAGPGKSALDSVYLAIPDVSEADKSRPRDIPTLPPRIKSFLEKSKVHLDAQQMSDFEADDFFGRPIQVLWQKRNPWPSLIKTSSEIAITIQKGVL